VTIDHLNGEVNGLAFCARGPKEDSAYHEGTYD
jgi:hypothetical protein